MVKQETPLSESCQIPYTDGSQLGGKERALSLSLECPNCKKYYRIAASSYRKWKSALIRCRKCGNGFPMAFSATEPPEPPQRPRALTVVRGTPVAAFRPDPPTHVSPVLPPEHPQGTPEDSSGIDLPPPPSGAGDDTSSVPHTEEPPILPLLELVTPCDHPWDRNSRRAFWGALTGAGIVVACFLAAAGLFWAVVTYFISM